MAVNIDISPWITNVKAVETPKEQIIVCRRFHANPGSVFVKICQSGPTPWHLHTASVTRTHTCTHTHTHTHTHTSNHFPKSNLKVLLKPSLWVCVLFPSLFSCSAQPVLLVSVLGHWKLFVPLAETEEEGRRSHHDPWPPYPPCGDLWYQLCVLWAADRMVRLPIRADVLTLPGHSRTVPTPLTQPDKPLVTHPSSRLRSADLSVGYIPSNWITPSLQGGKEDPTVETDNQWWKAQQRDS